MLKKEIVISIVLGFLLFAFLFVVINEFKFQSFVVYDDSSPAQDLCGSIVYEDSTVTLAQTACAGASQTGNTFGGTINNTGITLNCNGNIINGGNVGGGSFGVKVNYTGAGAIIKNCDVRDFDTNLNISNSTTVIDSRINAVADPVEAWVAPNINATFLNVSFTDTSAKIQVQAGANLTVQYYIIVNVTNTTGGPISGASVRVYNESALASQLSGVTNAAGLVFFNITDKVKQSAADINFTYWINASKSGSYGQNTSYDVFASTGIQMVNFSISDTAAPLVTIVSPVAGTYTVDNYVINITLNEAGYCEYSLDGGATNNTLTPDVTNISFNGTRTGVANGAYTFLAYCNDTAGITNYTTNVSFTVSVSAGGSGGGGGGGCTESSWTCRAWGSCVNGNQTRSCVSNCLTTRIETQSCIACADECVAGKICNGNVAESCSLVNGCYKLIRNDCALLDNYVCLSGACVSCSLLLGENTTEDNVTVSEEQQNLGSENSNVFFFSIPDLFLPSDYIPHGDIPAGVVDAGAGIVVIGGIAGISWIIWLWLLSLFLPLFWVRLRHYTVPIFDSANALGMFNSKTVNVKRLTAFLSELDKGYGKIIFAEKSNDMIKYLVARGFIEIRLDEPFVLIGHFTAKSDAEIFKSALRNTINRFGGRKIRILDSVEKASMIEAWRAWRRNKKSERELRKLFEK